MKSVIEEGSSISKAIQSGWTKAGKPKEFTVKIFQEPKKNFFGFTIIVAKIGIFFNEDYKEKDKNTSTRPSNQYRHNNHNRPNPHHSKNINTQGQNQSGQRASETNANRTDSQSQKQNGEQANQRPYPQRNRHRPYNKFRKKTDNGTNSKPK